MNPDPNKVWPENQGQVRFGGAHKTKAAAVGLLAHLGNQLAATEPPVKESGWKKLWHTWLCVTDPLICIAEKTNWFNTLFNDMWTGIMACFAQIYNYWIVKSEKAAAPDMGCYLLVAVVVGTFAFLIGAILYFGGGILSNLTTIFAGALNIIKSWWDGVWGLFSFEKGIFRTVLDMFLWPFRFLWNDFAVWLTNNTQASFSMVRITVLLLTLWGLEEVILEGLNGYVWWEGSPMHFLYQLLNKPIDWLQSGVKSVFGSLFSMLFGMLSTPFKMFNFLLSMVGGAVWMLFEHFLGLIKGRKLSPLNPVTGDSSEKVNKDFF